MEGEKGAGSEGREGRMGRRGGGGVAGVEARVGLWLWGWLGLRGWECGLLLLCRGKKKGEGGRDEGKGDGRGRREGRSARCWTGKGGMVGGHKIDGG